MRWIIALCLLGGFAPAAEPVKPGVQLPGAAAEDARARIDAAIDKGVSFLVKSQQPDGSWGTGRVTRGFEVYSSVPGSHDAYRVGTTALCVMALKEAGETEAHQRGLEYLIEHGEARRDQKDMFYNTWAHIYALQALAIEMHDNKDPRLKKAAEWQLDRLAKYETLMGGWNYYDFGVGTQTPSEGPTSFSAAAGLVALWEARQAGLDVPQKMIDRALRCVAAMRLPTGSYLYGDYMKYRPTHPANRTRGSIGRNQACNYALWLWGNAKVGEKESREGLEEFGKEHIFIDMGRQRQFRHESWYATAPYYYYFGHYYAARILEKLPEKDRAELAKIVLDGILPNQDPDGSWWDFAMWDYHKPYGTAYAVMTLRRCK